MYENFEYIKMFARFPFGLRRFLRHTLTLEQAQAIVRERMARREENFLTTVERSVYSYPASPYLWLLKQARCELNDLRALVRRLGLEGTLRELRGQGVFVTFEEFKGRRPIVRNGNTRPVTARDFDNPSVQRVFNLTTGGSTGTAVTVGVDLDQIAASAPHELLALAAHGLNDVPEIRWNGILPASTLRTILRSTYIGHVPKRWFSPAALRDSKSWVKYGLATYYVLGWMRLQGVPVPFPRRARQDQALVIARAVADMLRRHGCCLINTNVSRALRVILAARAAGVDLRGAVFRGGAEPATPGKIQQIESAGVSYLSNYSMVEASRVGAACARRAAVDDVHLLKDAFALFCHPFRVGSLDVDVPAFNLTTLLPSAAKIMLNVQMDDYGIVEERACGCELERCGFTTHLREIRSYGKLTGEGVTLLGNELLRVLDEVLPARFGGSPLDYQLVEQEDGESFTRLYLVISPRVQIADEQAVVDTLLAALAQSSPMADAARTVWQHSQTIRVKRSEPASTARGKLMPLHLAHQRQTVDERSP